MCGIVGILDKEGVNPGHIDPMVTRLHHRGPDAKGTYLSSDVSVALGQTRLSIIDLSENANQPFYSRCGRYVIVFNGEIYNFKKLRETLAQQHGVSFRTSSDTEVVIEAFVVWGDAMVHKLEGMFAFAIYDQVEKTLFLVRDRIGKKPLFYFQSYRFFAFASEIKSLVEHPRVKANISVNKDVIASFLHFGYIPEPQTIFTSIHKFPSGHFGKVNGTKLKLMPYWSVPEVLNQTQLSNPSQAVNTLDSLLDKAVEKRLVSDVPLGTFLSGGTDSSIVTAYTAKHHLGKLKTFNIGFEESAFDESPYARQVAKILGTDHTECVLRETDALSLLDSCLSNFDEPFADTSAIPTMLVSSLARKDVKVILTGDGGDELFMGYGAYTWANRLQNPAWLFINESIRKLLDSSRKSQWQRVAQLLKLPLDGNIRSHIFSQEHYLFSQYEIQENLLSIDSPNFHYDETFLDKTNLTAAEKQALFDLQFYLKNDLLVKVDRSSMYHSLECRCPLLDNDIVNFAYQIHPSLKLKGSTSKWILKELLHKHLPDDLVNRPKRGFSVPLSKWLKTDLHYLVEKYLQADITEALGLFKWSYISQMKNEFLSGTDYLYNRLWVIIVLHKWLSENGIPY